jgi:small subunit ribosomal protein S21
MIFLGVRMPGIRLFPDEAVERALKRFKKQCEKAGIVSDLKKHSFFEKRSIRLKKKSAAARKREIKKNRKFGS